MRIRNIFSVPEIEEFAEVYAAGQEFNIEAYLASHGMELITLSRINRQLFAIRVGLRVDDVVLVRGSHGTIYPQWRGAVK